MSEARTGQILGKFGQGVAGMAGHIPTTYLPVRGLVDLLRPFMLLQYPALDANWREQLAKNPFSLIFCWANWSPQDIMLRPVLARVIPDCPEFVFYTADLDNENLVSFFTENGIATNPQLLLWQEGRIVKQSIGYMTDANLREKLDEWKEILDLRP